MPISRVSLFHAARMSRDRYLELQLIGLVGTSAPLSSGYTQIQFSQKDTRRKQTIASDLMAKCRLIQ